MPAVLADSEGAVEHAPVRLAIGNEVLVAVVTIPGAVQGCTGHLVGMKRVQLCQTKPGDQ